MAKKNNNSNINDLMAKLGASLKESPIKAHQRQNSTPKKSLGAKKASTKPTVATQETQAPTAQSNATNTPVSQPQQNQQFQHLQRTVKNVTAPKATGKASYRGWKTSTVGLYPEDYQKAQELMNYIQQETGENTNLSRAIKIALRAIEIGPGVLDINNEIKSKDGRLVSRRQLTA